MWHRVCSETVRSGLGQCCRCRQSSVGAGRAKVNWSAWTSAAGINAELEAWQSPERSLAARRRIRGGAYSSDVVAGVATGVGLGWQLREASCWGTHRARHVPSIPTFSRCAPCGCSSATHLMNFHAGWCRRREYCGELCETEPTRFTLLHVRVVPMPGRNLSPRALGSGSLAGGSLLSWSVPLVRQHLRIAHCLGLRAELHGLLYASKNVGVRSRATCVLCVQSLPEYSVPFCQRHGRFHWHRRRPAAAPIDRHAATSVARAAQCALGRGILCRVGAADPACYGSNWPQKTVP